MSEASANVSISPSPSPAKIDDGRSRMVGNVLASWGGQLIRIASGFVMPRLIDHQIGQEALGVWDVSWSVIAHLGLVQAGISGSVNRYVAQCRTSGDFGGLNRVVSSVAGVMRAMGALVFVLTLVCVLFVDHFLGASLGSHANEARWLVLLLGISLAVQLSTGMYGGVITGYHRWDLHNLVYAVTNILMLVGGAITLLAGGGLIGLATVCLATEFLGRLMRWHYARRLCPTLSIRREHMEWKTAMEMVRFGGKMFLVQISQLVLNQTLNIFIALQFGPAAVALFARPSALVHHVETVIAKYANVLVPTAGVIQTAGDRSGQQNLLLQASRAGAFMCIPVTLFLVLLGDDVIRLWMGAKYVQSGLMIALPLGWFFYLANVPLFNVLSGFNLHGKPAIANVIVAILALPAAWLAISSGGGLTLLAASVLTPIALMNGIWMPIYACRQLGIPLGRYCREVWLAPLACAVPFGLVLFAAKSLFPGHSAAAVLSGMLAGGLVLGTAYWFWALPATWRHKLRARFA